MSKPSLKALALAPMAGFRKKKSPFRSGITPKSSFVSHQQKPGFAGRALPARNHPNHRKGRSPEAPELTPSERAFRTMRADVTLFIDILLDTDLQPVFTVDDTEQVEAIYGPVHSRLLKQALDLIRDADDAKAK
jgi:hypothetical protein